MKFSIKFVLLVCSLRLISGCGNKSTTPPPPPAPKVLMYVDEPIVKAFADPVPMGANYVIATIFDLGQVPMVLDSSYNDFIINYTTPSTCDENHWIFNVRKGQWDQFASDTLVRICDIDMWCQGHLLSNSQLTAADYVDDSLEVRIRPSHNYEEFATGLGSCPFTITPVILDARYSSVRISVGPYGTADVIAYDGTGFWSRDIMSDILFHYDLQGKSQFAINSPVKNIIAMTCRGTDLWLLTANSEFYRLDQRGKILCHFTMAHPSHALGHLTYLDGKLWVMSVACSGNECRDTLFSIDIDSSCDASTAITHDTIAIGGSVFPGELASRGDHLLYLNTINGDADSTYLVEITTAGQQVATYLLPVIDPIAAECDGDRLWLLHHGPLGTPPDQALFSEFKLR